MRSLVHLPGSPFGGGYSGVHVVYPWFPGEVREVEEAVAAYLLEELGQVFAEVPATEPVAPEPKKKPKKD